MASRKDVQGCLLSNSNKYKVKIAEEKRRNARERNCEEQRIYRSKVETSVNHQFTYLSEFSTLLLRLQRNGMHPSNPKRKGLRRSSLWRALQ